jgi:hypothetical protein
MLSKESYRKASSASKPKREWIDTVLASNNTVISVSGTGSRQMANFDRREITGSDT